MIYTTKRCPHCGFKYVNHDPRDQRKYGCPLLTCPSCKQKFWDSDIKEPVLYGYKLSIKYLISLFWWFLITIVFIVISIYAFSEGELTGLIPLLFGLFSLFVVVANIRSLIDERKNRWVEYELSFMRLQNTEYLNALAEYDSRAKRISLSPNYQFSHDSLKELFYSWNCFDQVKAVKNLVEMAIVHCNTMKDIDMPPCYTDLSITSISNLIHTIYGYVIELPDAKIYGECNYIALMLANGNKYYFTSEKIDNTYGLCEWKEEFHFAKNSKSTQMIDGFINAISKEMRTELHIE